MRARPCAHDKRASLAALVTVRIRVRVSTPPLRPVAPRGRPRFTPRQAFQQFGDVVSCRLEREPRERGGQSKGYGFIEYNRRGVAAKVQQLLTDNLFLLGASPRPVHVEFAIDEGGADGAPVDPSLALQPPPHFAQVG